MEKPLPASAGPDPFVFVCYSHADRELVYPEIRRLQSQGFLVWYDDGITPGSEWNAAIADAIERCSVFLYYVTPHSVASEHCRREVVFAVEQSCSVQAVHAQQTAVPAALRLLLSHRQAILKHELTPERYGNRLATALQEAAAGENPDQRTGSQAMRIGDWVLDISTQRLTRGDDARLLEPKDVSVLLHLVEADGSLISTEELLDRSWPGAIVGDNVVHQVIRRLRKAFDDSARNSTYIETLPKRGYRLLQPVEDYEREPDAKPPKATAMEAAEARLPAPPPAAAPTAAVDATRRPPWLWLALGVIAAVLVLAVTALLLNRGEPEHPRSIAALSFLDMSANGDLADLANDIPAVLITRLQRVEGLQAVGTSASFAYRDSDLDIREIGEQLGVAYIVAGTVRKSGPRIRVTIELVAMDTLYQQWSELYNRTLDDAFNAEDEIAVEAALGIVRSFEADLPTLQLTPPSPDDPKPSLQQLFDQSPEQPVTTEFPSLEDVDIQSFDDLGDVE